MINCVCEVPVLPEGVAQPSDAWVRCGRCDGLVWLGLGGAPPFATENVELKHANLVQILSKHQYDPTKGLMCSCGTDFTAKLKVDHKNDLENQLFLLLAGHQLDVLHIYANIEMRK